MAAIIYMCKDKHFYLPVQAIEKIFVLIGPNIFVF